ncbi:OmpH family outer membrane protein [uncultured Succinatimonas sp.]|uniref:OmpH family outer membrane protein n=1 Tax=uncultured Succinatimonas sp. TaxID=1262973 RepID=UPI0025F1AD3B|nr:OmpH family outer membrane protein [uncultured Succinatimonas sp.]
MFKKIALALAVASIAATPAMAAEKAQTPTVAVINVPLIMHEIPQAKTTREKLAKEFAPRERELQNLEAEGNKLAQKLKDSKLSEKERVDLQRRFAQMQSDFNLKAQALQEDQRKRVADENLKLAQEVQKAIDAIAKERGIQLVLRGESVAYTVNALDISQDVIDRAGKSGKK